MHIFLHGYGNFSFSSIARCFLAASSCLLMAVSSYLCIFACMYALPISSSFVVWDLAMVCMPPFCSASRKPVLCCCIAGQSLSTCAASSVSCPQCLHSSLCPFGNRCLSAMSALSDDALTRSWVMVLISLFRCPLKSR